MTSQTAKIRIHHATAKKAEKAGVVLRVDGDRVVAVDPAVDPDHEYSGDDAARLLALVLSKRPGEGDDDDGDDDDGDDGDGDDGEDDGDDGEDDGDEGEGDDEAEEAEGGTIVKPKYKQAYAEHDDTCGDAFAEALSVAGRTSDGTLDLDACRGIAIDNGLGDRWTEWTATLNPGQRRMCLGNVLRGMVRRGETVRIGRQSFVPVRDAEGNLVRGEYETNKPRGAVR